jgi:hypothetical protein
VEPVQVARRQRAASRLLGGLGGTGQEPFVLAEFQGEVQGPRRGRGRSCGYGSFSVFEDKDVLPDGDLYHFRYPSAYMVSNDQDQLPGRLA